MKKIRSINKTAIILAAITPSTLIASDELFDYSGQAKTLAANQPPPSQKFIHFASGFIEGKFFDNDEDRDETCSLYNPKFIEVDIDGDNIREGIATYTIEGCDGSNGWSRLAEVFIKKGNTYSHAGTIQKGSSMFGSSDITMIRYGIISVGNNSQDDPLLDGSYLLKNGKLRSR